VLNDVISVPSFVLCAFKLVSVLIHCMTSGRPGM